MPVKSTKKLNTAKVMSSVASVVSFMKQQAVADLMEAKSQGKIEISTEDLKRLVFM